MLTKQEILSVKGAQVESSGIREPRRTALLRDWFYGDGISFRVGLWPIILIQSLYWWRMHCSAKMDAGERDFGKWTDRRCLLSTFPELFRLVVAYSVFLTRISCHKTTWEWLLWCLGGVGGFMIETGVLPVIGPHCSLQ